MFHLMPRKQRLEPSRELISEPTETPLARLRSELESLKRRFWAEEPQFDEQWLQSGLGWAVEVDEHDDHFLLRAEAPGFEADDFDVQVRDKTLTIVAEHQQQQRREEEQGLSRSYHYGRFQRTASLPLGADPENVSASYRNGILEIRMGKSPEKCGKRIEVRSD